MQAAQAAALQESPPETGNISINAGIIVMAFKVPFILHTLTCS